MSRYYADHSGFYIEEVDEMDAARVRRIEDEIRADEEIPTNRGPMTPLQIIGDLTYINYATNRNAAPHITPESWKKVYGPEVDSMEARYQAEHAKAA